MKTTSVLSVRGFPAVFLYSSNTHQKEGCLYELKILQTKAFRMLPCVRLLGKHCIVVKLGSGLADLKSACELNVAV